MEEKRKRSFEHVIREHWCKGCSVCIAFCPKKVLTLKNGKVFAEKPHECIGCRLCELRCPDYAIEIAETGLPEPEPKEAATDCSIPPEAQNV